MRNIKYPLFLSCILLAWILPLRESSCAPPLSLKGRYDYSKGWYHRVQKGDTLDSLAKKYNRSKTLIAQVNGLNPEKSLREGWYLYIPPTQNPPVIKKSPPALSSAPKTQPKPSNPPPAPLPPTPRSKVSRKTSATGFIWPLSGKVIKSFSDSKSDPHKGIDIAAKKGSIALAAKSGKVIYSDSDIPGYGKLIIIDHGDQINSVYAHNSELFVKVGQSVRQGDPIARSGDTGKGGVPHLHFEIRRKAIPVNPIGYLP